MVLSSVSRIEISAAFTNTALRFILISNVCSFPAAEPTRSPAVRVMSKKRRTNRVTKPRCHEAAAVMRKGSGRHAEPPAPRRRAGGAGAPSGGSPERAARHFAGRPPRAAPRARPALGAAPLSGRESAAPAAGPLGGSRRMAGLVLRAWPLERDAGRFELPGSHGASTSSTTLPNCSPSHRYCWASRTAASRYTRSTMGRM